MSLIDNCIAYVFWCKFKNGYGWIRYDGFVADVDGKVVDDY